MQTESTKTLNLRSCICALAAFAIACTLYGCGAGKPAFLMQQVCLRDVADLSAFTQEMQSIAQSEGTALIDRSVGTQKELDAIGHPIEGARTRPVINMGFYRRDGIGLTVTNLGLPRYEVAVGFSEGSNPADARRFADSVVTKLAQHWHVEPVPAGTGAQEMKNCD